jgi:hypothetical protein
MVWILELLLITGDYQQWYISSGSKTASDGCGKAQMNSAGNPENYQIFPANPKMDGMEGQPYSDRFPRHHIPFLYRLLYLPNHIKITRKYGKTEPIFPGILPTVFTLTHCAADSPESSRHRCPAVAEHPPLFRLTG